MAVTDPARHDFVGTGWAFPPTVNDRGGIAMVSGERELEQAIQIILLTYPGERPMRPDVRQPDARLRVPQRRSVDRRRTRARGSELGAAMGAAGRRLRRLRDSPTSSNATGSTSRSCTSSSAPTTGATWCSPSTRSPTTGVSTDGDCSSTSRRPSFPGPGRRRQADGDGPVSGVDRPQRVRPWRDADRDLRLRHRSAAVPPEPCARSALHQVPRADRNPPVPTDRGESRRHVLALRRRRRRRW